jgi:predicted transcriptional regulator
VVHEYRDRIFIRKDILLKLCEYGEINQSKLMSYCGLNNVKHKEILDDMVKKGLINRVEENWGSKVIINYKVSERGRLVLNEILAPYEELVPRKFLVSPIQFSS